MNKKRFVFFFFLLLLSNSFLGGEKDHISSYFEASYRFWGNSLVKKAPTRKKFRYRTVCTWIALGYLLLRFAFLLLCNTIILKMALGGPFEMGKYSWNLSKLWVLKSFNLNGLKNVSQFRVLGITGLELWCDLLDFNYLPNLFKNSSFFSWWDVLFCTIVFGVFLWCTY